MVVSCYRVSSMLVFAVCTTWQYLQGASSFVQDKKVGWVVEAFA